MELSLPLRRSALEVVPSAHLTSAVQAALNLGATCAHFAPLAAIVACMKASLMHAYPGAARAAAFGSVDAYFPVYDIALQLALAYYDETPVDKSFAVRLSTAITRCDRRLRPDLQEDAFASVRVCCSRSTAR